MPWGVRLSEGLGGTDARPPVAGLTPEGCYCQHYDLIFADYVYDGKLELAWEDTTGSELVWKARIGKLRNQGFGLLHCLVKPTAKARADCCEVLNLLQELFTSFLNVANPSHR